MHCSMHLGKWARGAFAAVVTLVSIPIVLPVAIASIVISTRRFWRLRTGDVLGTSYVVLHPPKKHSEFHVLEISKPCILYTWKNTDVAHYCLSCMLPESSFTELMRPLQCTKRLPLHEVTELLMAGETGGYRTINHNEYYGYLGEKELSWMRRRSFEITRPARVIQRAWRAHVARRREAAARVITRAALHFLYRPNAWGYEEGLRRWRDGLHGTQENLSHLTPRQARKLSHQPSSAHGIVRV